MFSPCVQGARADLQLARKELTQLAEGVGRQLADRDRTHADRVHNLENLMDEKERQLMQAANVLRQQLAAARRDLQQLQQLQCRGEQLLATAGFSGDSLEQEVASLRLVLEMRRVEVEQLRAANNGLVLELERCRGQQLQLQQQNQRVEEMQAVIHNKNIEIRYRGFIYIVSHGFKIQY